MGCLSKAAFCRAVLALVVLAAGLSLVACGDSGDTGAEQLAKQQELRAAREEAAQDARQSAKIAELERKVKRAQARRGSDSGTGTAGPITDSAPPVGADEPLAGLWKGEAVIEYESGEADPFNQTIEIDDALVPGAVVGYSEARQGSTTCHGPLTYEGVSEGWYRFSAAERNVDECIDYSEVELMPDASGGLAYRETTEVSVSTGTLERVG
jgi:hypothetical protein